jgi:phosphohistidine phosphatase
MRIILFRHGPAGTRDASRWPDDGTRPLTPRGEERTRDAASGLSRLEPGAGFVFTSPLARALQTARILEDTLDDAKVETLDDLRPGGSLRKVIDWIAADPKIATAVLVGHEPDLGKLAGTLLFGAPSALPLKKAGACAIDFEDIIRPGGGRLAWFLTPKMLRRMAKKKHRV